MHSGENHGSTRDHRHGHPAMRRAMRIFMMNALITQFFARAFMVVAGVSLMKIAASLALSARVKTLSELRDDLTAEQRAELVDDIWVRARGKRKACCTPMPSMNAPADRAITE